MRLKLAQIVKLNAAVAGILLGRTVVVRQNNQDAAVIKPFDFDSDTSWAFAKIAMAVEPKAEAFNKAARAIQKKIVEGAGAAAATGIKAGSLQELQLSDELDNLLAAEEDVELPLIDLPKLKLSDNPELRQYLVALNPVIKEPTT